MNTLVSAVILVGAVLVAQGSAAEKVLEAKVGSKAFYTVKGMGGRSYQEAVKTCRGAGMKLAMVENGAESDALYSALRKRDEEHKEDQFWIGAIFKNNKWIWEATGKELTYTDWKPIYRTDDPGRGDDNDDPPIEGQCAFMGTRFWKYTDCIFRNVPLCQE